MGIQLYYFNIWSVLVGFVSNMVIGSLWYSPVLFGNKWLELTGRKAEDISKEDARKSMTLSMIPGVLSIVLLALILGVANSTTMADALVLGSLVSAGIIGMSNLNQVFFEGRPFKLILLNTGYSFVAMNIAALIITFWR